MLDVTIYFKTLRKMLIYSLDKGFSKTIKTREAQQEVERLLEKFSLEDFVEWPHCYDRNCTGSNGHGYTAP